MSWSSGRSTLATQPQRRQNVPERYQQTRKTLLMMLALSGIHHGSSRAGQDDCELWLRRVSVADRCVLSVSTAHDTRHRVSLLVQVAWYCSSLARCCAQGRCATQHIGGKPVEFK